VVSWTAPAGNGGSTVTGYTVRAVQDTAKTCAWTGGPLSCTVTGLAAGTAYTFTVRATNAAGTGAASAPSNSITTSLFPGSLAFRVTGANRPYTFRLPAGASEAGQVTMSISDIRGRTIWIRSIYPSRDAQAREVTWNGKTATGHQASAGMYVVHLAVKHNGTTTNYVRKTVTHKP
jgi:hypothetical protein